ncbi:MAG: ATP-binding protein [Candidatus Bathyarchaeia archaeon]
MSRVEENLKRYFTDFDGKFDAQLSSVFSSTAGVDEQFGTSSQYQCQIKARYNRDLMRLLDDGMLLAVKNFKTTPQRERYTLLEVVRFWPEHFGLKGVKSYQYFPMQFEVIQQSVKDWETDDKTTMMVQLDAIPINYDLILDGGGYSFERGFSYPTLGSQVYILNRAMIKEMYNREIPKKLGCSGTETCADAYKDPRLGTIKMFESLGEKIPIYVDFDALVRFHFGIFAFTGGGKSNLLSNILRRILIHQRDVKVIIFDISCEYPFLLMDILADKKIESKVILEREVENARQFYDSVVKPKKYELDTRVLAGMEKILSLGRVTHFRRERFDVPTYSDFISDIDKLKEANAANPNYIEALDDVQELAFAYMNKNRLSEDDKLSKEFVNELIDAAENIAQDYRVHEKSALYGWFQSRHKMLKYFEQKTQASSSGCTTQEVEQLLDGEARLISLSISEPETIKQLAFDIAHDILQRRKRQFKIKPYILFVFDEAQEFVASPSNVSGIDKKCSLEVERLLRQGRKYGLGGCIATQRIAYLNTNALQQLHTYFVSTLPRPYDRSLISDTFMIDKAILEKTLEFVPGEWLLSSYLATGMTNVPVFIKADNADNEVEKYLQKQE